LRNRRSGDIRTLVRSRLSVMSEALTLAPTPDPRVFVAADGRLVTPPADWVCLPPGDAAITRKVKQAGPSWAVVEKKGRKIFSRGVWAPRENVEAARAAVESERSTPEYAKRRGADLARRERTESEYVAEFEAEVLASLRFSKEWHPLGVVIARKIAAHATPVGSGTVARTKRIPVAERAEVAVIAWMRHQTTAYDRLDIPRIKGKRREVRRALAEVSRKVLDLHRRDVPHGIEACPLCAAVVAAAAADRDLT